jgi:hypothetical protein
MHCLELSKVSCAVSRNDLRAAKSWVIFAEAMDHSSAMIAYKTTLRFLDHYVAALSSSSHHFDVIRQAVSSIATDAFSCSVRHGALTTAVELVEQGRAVFWTQLARFSTPLDELSASGDAGTALAEEFKRLSLRLRNTFDISTEDQSPQIRQLTMQWDDAISRIRMVHGFSRFLLPPLFPDLQKAAEDGPVPLPGRIRLFLEFSISAVAQHNQTLVHYSTIVISVVPRMQVNGSEDENDDGYYTRHSTNPSGRNQHKDCRKSFLCCTANKPLIACFSAPKGDHKVADLLREYHRRNISDRKLLSKLLQAEHGIKMR